MSLFRRPIWPRLSVELRGNLQPDSDGAFCQSFCGCTLDQMRAQSLFEPFNRGQVTMEDPRIGALANQCTSKALEQPPQ